MRTLAIILFLGATAQTGPLRSQVMAGRPFTTLLAETDRRCPGVPIRSASPAGLLDAEEQFADQLDRRQEGRVGRAIPRLRDGSPRACADSPGGAACPATAGLLAIERARLLPEFARMACALPSIWR